MKNDFKFYTCKYDRSFKEVFLNENNRELLKTLLEFILQIQITDIKIKPTERTAGNVNIKKKVFDALVTTDIGKIAIEVNANLESFVHPRNMAYISDLYASHTLKSMEYNEDVIILQINLTYGMYQRNKDKKPYRVYQMQDESGHLFIKNMKIYEFNMDYYKEIWQNKNREVIEQNKLLIMLDLEKSELKELSKNDKVVERYMKELEKVNENVEFREYMSAEEDARKIYNSRMNEATKIGIEQGRKEQNLINAKEMKKNGIPIDIILRITGLSKNEIENLK